MENEAGRGADVLDVVIGLGANVGEPEAALRGAVVALAALGPLSGVSGLYRTRPVGGPPQPDFLNAAARLQFQGSVHELLEAALDIERGAGRERRERWGPRTLDLDILWVKGVTLTETGLTVPHPRLRERAFALQPLLDVAPEAVDPSDGAAYRSVLERLDADGIELLRRDWIGAVAGQMSRGMDRPCS